LKAEHFPVAEPLARLRPAVRYTGVSLVHPLDAMLAFLVNPAVIGLAVLLLSIVWMLRDEKDRTRPLLVIALVLNLVYGWVLAFVMGKENGLVPWKYDYVLARLDDALGLNAAPIATALLHAGLRMPLFVVYQLMVPLMVVWFFVARARR